MPAPVAPAAALRQPAAPAAAQPAPGTPAKPAPGAPGAPAAVPGAPGAPKAPAAPAANALEPGDLGEPGTPGATGAQPAAGTWPDDWREQLVGSDEKLLKRLGRYASPRDVANALIAAQNRISSGELRPALKENATAEEIAAYRAESGIPPEPTGYPMPDGILFGEDDKPFIESFLKSMHGINAHPGFVTEALKWYHADREAQIEALVAQDDQHRIATVEAMVAHWGTDNDRNKNMVNALINSAPPEIAAKLKGARGPDDRALLNDWGMLEWLHSVAHQINPASTVVPGATGDIGMAIGDEIAKWDTQMGDKNSDYWGGKTHDKAIAEKNQARYRELIDARDRYQQKK